jgi:hypothetical protein
VVVSLLLATATLMFVTVSTARAAGVLMIGQCGAFGEAHDFRGLAAARESTRSKCRADNSRAVVTARHSCAAFAAASAFFCDAKG